MASRLIVLLCGFAFGAAALRTGSARRAVTDVHPESYDEVVANGVDTAGMVKLHIAAWDGSGENVTIMGYTKAEDKEISGSLAYDAHWETRLTHDLCAPWTDRHLRGIFLDIGANIGTYTLPMAACTARTGNGSVISVEGMPSIAEHLRAGIVANGARNVELYGYAVGAAGGPDSVTMTLDPENKGGSAVAGNKGELKAGVQEVQVPLTTVDHMFAQDPRFAAVLSAKVDIEGNEGRMLNGAMELFGKYPPCKLMIELIPDWLEASGTPVEGILKTLRDLGYARVPTADHLRTCKWAAKTIKVDQADMAQCEARVEAAYAALRL